MMNIQENIIALLEGELRDDRQVMELMQHLVASVESRSMLIEHVALSNLFAQKVIRTVPDPQSSAKIFDRIHQYEQTRTGQPRSGNWFTKQTWPGIVLALLVGLGLGYLGGNKFGSSASSADPASFSAVSQVEHPSDTREPVNKHKPAVQSVDRQKASAAELPQAMTIRSRTIESGEGMESAPIIDSSAVLSPPADLSFQLLTPNGGEHFSVGSAVQVDWSGTTEPVTIEYSADNGSSWSEIASGIIDKPFVWSASDDQVVPQTPSNLIRVSIEDTAKLEPSLSRVFAGHDSGVSVAEISPDGKYLLTVGSDTRVILWDVFSGKAVRTMEGHTGFVTYARFNLDGTRFVSCSQDGTARVWDVQTGALQHIFYGRGNQYPVPWSAAFSPDGTTVAVGNDDGTISFYRLSDGTELEVLEGAHNEAVRYMEYTEDGTRMIASGSDRDATVIDIVADTVIQRFTHFPFPVKYNARRKVVNGVQLTSDGTMVISCGYDGVVRYWDVETGTLLLERSYHDGAPVSAVVLGKEEKIMASVGYDGTVKIIDLDSANVVATIRLDVDAGIPVSRASFSQDMRYIATAHGDGKARLWKLRKVLASDVSDKAWEIK